MQDHGPDYIVTVFQAWFHNFILGTLPVFAGANPGSWPMARQFSLFHDTPGRADASAGPGSGIHDGARDYGERQ